MSLRVISAATAFSRDHQPLFPGNFSNFLSASLNHEIDRVLLVNRYRYLSFRHFANCLGMDAVIYDNIRPVIRVGFSWAVLTNEKAALEAAKRMGRNTLPHLLRTIAFI